MIDRGVLGVSKSPEFPPKANANPLHSLPRRPTEREQKFLFQTAAWPTEKGDWKGGP